LFHESLASAPTDRKVEIALELERVATTSDARVRKVDHTEVGDAISGGASAAAAGVAAEWRRTACWAVVEALAEEEDETQSGWSLRVGRDLDELGWREVAPEAAPPRARGVGAGDPR